MSIKSVGFVALCSGLVLACMKSEEPQAGASDSAPEAAPAPAPPAAPAIWQARYDGIGPIRVGATVAELEAALNTRLARRDSLHAQCDYLRAPEVIPGVWFMIIQGQVARLDIDSAGPATAEGVRIGDDSARVESVYGPRVAVTPHKYTDGKYLTVTPAAAADSGYRIIFELNGGRVTRYRAGRLPEVGWVESCS